MISLPDKPTYRVQEVAFLLDVTDHSVRRWCQFGKLESVKVAGVVRIERTALLRFLEESGIKLLR